MGSQGIRRVLTGLLLCLAVGAFASPSGALAKNNAAEAPPAVAPAQALQLLEEGNRRFVEGTFSKKDLGRERRMNLVQKGQWPFAVVLSCADSRVPPEIIFDQGLGDLFVLRVAGNVLAPVITGSIEYSQTFAVPLVVVMGHTQCGAVQTTVDGTKVSDTIAAIVARIAPALKAVREGRSAFAEKDVYAAVTSENVAQIVAELKKNPELKPNIDSGRLNIVGAKYHQDSGKVEFF